MRKISIKLLILFLLISCSKLKEPGVELTTDGGRFSLTSRYMGLKNINPVIHLSINNNDIDINLADITPTFESVDYFENPLGSGVVTKIEGSYENIAKISLYINNYNTNFYTILLSIDNISDAEITIKGFSLVVDGNNGSDVSGGDEIDGVFSNGYQSWMPAMVSRLLIGTQEDEIKFENVENNEDTLFVDIRTSWWASLMHGPKQSIITGALTAERFKTRILNYKSDGRVIWKIRCGKTKVNNFSAEDKITLTSGESASSEKFFIGIYTDPLTGLDEYGRAIALYNPAPTPPFIPVGWNSWNELFTNINETVILNNAQFIKNNLPEHGFNNIQIDDGWERAWGDWEPNTNFPQGMDGIANKIRDIGFIPGIWMAPFLISASAPLFTQHNDWLLRDENGLLLKYDRYYILDTTNPEALNWLLNEIQKVISWGYRYLKLDFLFAGAYEGKRFNRETSMQAYRNALREILEVASKSGAYVLACGAPLLPTAGLAHGIRIGGDIAFSAIPYSISFIKNEARNIANRFFYNHVFANDPDTALLRAVSLEEAKMNLTSVLLSGKIFALGDNLPLLPPEKIELIKKINSFPVFSLIKQQGSKFVLKPVDMFQNLSEASNSIATLLVYPETYSVPSIWSVKINENSAIVGLFNFYDSVREIKFKISDAGLDSKKSYQVTELWTDSQEGSIKDEYITSIPQKTVKLLYLTPVEQ